MGYLSGERDMWALPVAGGLRQHVSTPLSFPRIMAALGFIVRKHGVISVYLGRSDPDTIELDIQIILPLFRPPMTIFRFGKEPQPNKAQVIEDCIDEGKFILKKGGRKPSRPSRMVDLVRRGDHNMTGFHPI